MATRELLGRHGGRGDGGLRRQADAGTESGACAVGLVDSLVDDETKTRGERRGALQARDEMRARICASGKDDYGVDGSLRIDRTST